MSDAPEDQIQLLLDGLSLNTDNCYVTIPQKEKNDVKSITATTTAYTPICQKTVTYIVAAVIVNHKEEILMMQEAKGSCHGKWYLPAGRVERNENLIEAVKREVLEETGLVMEPSTLIMVESASGSWFRFVFTGEIVAGELKTEEDANDESLQACWIHDLEYLQLRSNDIIPLIERAKNYRNNRTLQHPKLLPIIKSLDKLLLRLMIIAKKKATNRVNVLMSDAESSTLPICEINSGRSLLSTLRNFMMEIFGDQVPQHRPHGLLSVEFSGGSGGDGLCLTVLVSFKLPLEDVPVEGKYSWHQVTEEIEKTITTRLPKNMTIPLNVVR